jgi:hypothetical protein
MYQLLDVIKAVLGTLWDYRFTLLKQKARQVAFQQPGLSVEEAYRLGYREGYWDGTLDLYRVMQDHELLLLQLSQRHSVAEPLPSAWQALVGEVH